VIFKVVVEVCEGVYEGDLGEKHVETSMLVVPTKLIDGVFCTKSFTIAFNVAQEIIVLRRPP